ncbi:unnamed protein product, partial [Adineta steineri]
MADYISILQTSLKPLEFLQATMLLTKIASQNSFANLTNDELHLLAKIIKIILFHPTTLKQVFCSVEKFNLIFPTNSTTLNQTDI